MNEEYAGITKAEPALFDLLKKVNRSDGSSGDGGSGTSYVYVFRGAAGAVVDLFDIAGGSTGLWTAAIVYGGSGSTFTTGTTVTADPYTGGGWFAFINVSGTQRCMKFDVKNRVLSPAFYLRYPSGTAAVGQRMATAVFVDGATKLVFLILQRMAGAECFEMAVQK